jgi:hypothetical protein
MSVEEKNKNRIIVETNNQIIIEDGYGSYLRATFKEAGMFEVVAIDWRYPSRECFAEAIIWSRGSTQILPSWRSRCASCWLNRFNDKLDEFLKEYPEFKRFFEEDAKVRK